MNGPMLSRSKQAHNDCDGILRFDPPGRAVGRRLRHVPRSDSEIWRRMMRRREGRFWRRETCEDQP